MLAKAKNRVDRWRRISQEKRRIMPTVKQANPTPDQQRVIDQMAEFIDPQVIAGALVEEMVDYGVPVTYDNARGIFLKFSEELCGQFDSIIKYYFLGT